MYPLDRGLWGPTVRIGHLHRALAERVEVDLVSGYRGRRRLELARYAVSGRLRGLDGIYVESSSFLPAESDYAFLGLARALGIPVLTYVRDAYQLFDEYYPTDSLRRRIAARAFLPAVRALVAVSSQVAFPSAALAHVVLGPSAPFVLLPPGSPPPLTIARAAGANRLLFVGNGRLEAQGAARLIEAVGVARARGMDVELTILSRPGEGPPPPHPAWLRTRHAEGSAIESLIPEVVGLVIPRPRSPYNDLAVPIKVMDYLSYGRPLVVTDCSEQARIVTDADAGIVVGDTVDEMAAGIQRLRQASDAELGAWSANARAAARRHSWEARAREIVGLMGLGAAA